MKKIVFLALVAVLVSVGLVLASCDTGGCPGGVGDAGKCGTEGNQCTEQSCLTDLQQQMRERDNPEEALKCNC